VAASLAQQGLVRDAQVLAYYLRYQGLDSQVEAGDFILRKTMTVREVALALTDARAREVELRVIEGWRREQIAEALAAQPTFAGVANDFLALTGPNSPRPAAYPFLSGLAPGASLEGFLFPDTYLLRPSASASTIIDKMLADFQARLPSDYSQQVAARGLSVFQAITMASLIEREAVVDDERPIIASVIYNRLAAGQQLEIDASVQFAMGQSGQWWASLQGLDLHAINSPYNTYANSGLPPGPIANPGLSSIRAVASPAQTDYLYYRALCDGSGRHAFAATYDQHLANACP
jgi:peptidoglycan lytic transglycosylase G